MSEELTLEKLRINERLMAVEEYAKESNIMLKSNAERLLQLLENQQKSIDRINIVLFGNGTPGLNERVRGIEKMVNQVKVIWIAIIGFAANTIKDWFIK